MFDTVCAVFLGSNVSGFATGNSFCVTNITEANMEPFPRRGMLPKTQLHCPSKPSVDYCVHLDETGEQATLLFMHRKNMLHFSLHALWFDELERRELLLLFCCLTFSKRCPTDLRHSFGWSTSCSWLFIGSTSEARLSVRGDLRRVEPRRKQKNTQYINSGRRHT